MSGADTSTSPWLANVTSALMNTSGLPNASAGNCSHLKIPLEVFLMFGGVGLLENLLVIIAVVKNRNLHSPMYLFICSLAMADMLVSLASVLEAVTICLKNNGYLVTDTLIDHLDNLFDSLTCISLIASILSLGAISTDRYLSIFHSLRYHQIVTVKRAALIISGVWTFCTFSGSFIIKLYQEQACLGSLITMYFTTLFVIVSLYICMFLLARRHAQHIQSLPGQRVHRGTSFRGAITLTILLGIFIICWAPFFLHLILTLACPSNPYCTCYISLFEVDLILILCNSIIDPLIYAFRSPELRNTFKKMCSCFNKQLY